MADHQVVIAGDGVLGFQKAKDVAPELIILDAALPKMSGHQLIEKLKTPGEPLRTIPVIVVADRPRMEHLFRDEDIFYFCVKPVIPAQFLDRVVAAVKNSQTTAAFAGKVTEKPRRGPCILLAGVQEFIVAKMKKFLEQKGFLVEIAWDEADIMRKADLLRPDRIFVQFWEDMSTLNTPRILEKLKKKEDLKSVPVVAFCGANVLRDAMMCMPQVKVISFNESRDLLEKIEGLLGAAQTSRDERKPLP